MTICKQNTTVCSVSEWHFPDLKKNKEGKTVFNNLNSSQVYFNPNIDQLKTEERNERGRKGEKERWGWEGGMKISE